MRAHTRTHTHTHTHIYIYIYIYNIEESIFDYINLGMGDFGTCTKARHVRVIRTDHHIVSEMRV